MVIFMKKLFLILPLAVLTFTSCGKINETMDALESNRQAIDASTCTINENIAAIENANRGIEANTKALAEINKSLEKAGG